MMNATAAQAQTRLDVLLSRWKDANNPELQAKDLRDLKLIESVLRDAGETEEANALLSLRLDLKHEFSRHVGGGGS